MTPTTSIKSALNAGNIKTRGTKTINMWQALKESGWFWSAVIIVVIALLIKIKWKEK